MRRSLLNLLTVLSLLLCVVVLVLKYQTLSFMTNRHLYVEWSHPDGHRYHVRADPEGVVAFRFGQNLFGLPRIVVPYWVLFIATALIPGARLVRLTRERRCSGRLSRGLCPSCGYDLRATPERGPECGATTAAAGTQ